MKNERIDDFQRVKIFERTQESVIEIERKRARKIIDMKLLDYAFISHEMSL